MPSIRIYSDTEAGTPDPGWWGFLIHFDFLANLNFKSEILFSESTRVYARLYWSGSWKAWVVL